MYCMGFWVAIYLYLRNDSASYTMPHMPFIPFLLAYAAKQI